MNKFCEICILRNCICIYCDTECKKKCTGSSSTLYAITYKCNCYQDWLTNIFGKNPYGWGVKHNANKL